MPAVQCRTEAERRALEMLRAHLSEKQLAELERCGEFFETGRAPYRRQYHFVVWAGRAIVHGHCIAVNVADMAMPVADQVLALLLMLRADELAFREVSNNFRTWPTQAYV